jgi:predicted DNA-binding protein (MmcQ/YjbR family)
VRRGALHLDRAEDRRVTPRAIDRFCLALPHATKVVQWEGVHVYKIGGRMFCLVAPENHSVARLSIKVPDEHYEVISQAPGFRPAPYLARARWVSIDDPKAIPAADLKRYLRRAYDVVAAKLPRKTQRALGVPETSRQKPRPQRFDSGEA